MKCILVIDPGAAGGFAVQYPDGTVDAKKMMETPKDICDFISLVHAHALGNASSVKCYLEKVGGYMGGEGGNQAPATAMFNFGKGIGHLEGILIALGIPFDEVLPKKWQKALNLGTKGLERGNYSATMSAGQRSLEKKRVSQINGRLKTAWKNRLRDRAQKLFPHLHVTLAISDALLILEYAARQENIPLAPAPQQQPI